jgi:hypothetical protein
LTFNSLLIRLGASLAAILVLPLAPALAQTTLITPTARVIVKYKADSPLLRRETLAAGSQRITAREALAQRIGRALRAGADVGERTQVVFAGGITSEISRRVSRVKATSSTPSRITADIGSPRPTIRSISQGPPITGIAGGPTSGSGICARRRRSCARRSMPSPRGTTRSAVPASWSPTSTPAFASIIRI